MNTQPCQIKAPIHRVLVRERLQVLCGNLLSWKTRWAYRHLQKALSEDAGYRHTWLCNIAMPIYDATRPKCHCDVFGVPKGVHLPKCEVHQNNAVPRRFELKEMSIEQANYIAERLLNHLFPKEKTDEP